MEIDVDSELTIIGIAQDDVEIYQTIVREILNDVYQYEMMLASAGAPVRDPPR
ncbi:hypothetical protein [Natronoglomus mannanivorans]|uniref:Uncharacterized protein n=1 Tax=Natronoglomus mannanivorans TaxID=2979990 RepID=A0AAP2Z3X3_9EURY|nr:hypothetical protein [Halobacteria archaeon AArc-xg1-1]